MRIMRTVQFLFTLLLSLDLALNKVSSCKYDLECLVGECCGHGLLNTCVPYSKEGQPCHGSVASLPSCACAQGLVCEEYKGLEVLVHLGQGLGICRNATGATAVPGGSTTTTPSPTAKGSWSPLTTVLNTIPSILIGK